MNLRRVTALLAAVLALAGPAGAEEFTSMGRYVIRSQMKITGAGKIVQIPMKPLPLLVETDGVSVRIATGEESSNWSTFTIYRSDGIGRQSSAGGPLEVVPGVQATSDHGGVHKHLRLTRDTLVLSVFPGVSDQTMVTYAFLAPPAANEAAANAAADPPESP